MYQRYMWLVLVLTCFGTSGCGEDPPASGSGGNLGLPPIVRILAPADLSAFTPGDTIAFEGEVTDIKDHAVLLDIVWSSDLDGELDRTPADSSGRCRFQTAQLSHGRHTIELLATDLDGNSASRTIVVRNQVPVPCQLLAATSDYTRVHIIWSQADSTDFAEYIVCRSTTSGVTLDDSTVAAIGSVADTTASDTSITFEPLYYYRVFVTSISGYASGSNEVAVSYPAGLTYEAEIYDAACHPSEPWVYVLDPDQYRLLCLDYETMSPRDSLTFNTRPGYFDIGDNGHGIELYVPQRNYEIRVYDPATLAEVSLIPIGVRDVFSAIIDFRGHVIASLDPPAYWDEPLRTYSRDSGELIDGNGDLPNTRLRLLPSGLEIIAISTEGSLPDMDYYRLNDVGEIVEHVHDAQHGTHPMAASIFQVEASGRYLITSADGVLYRADETMEYLGTLPREGATFGDFAFSADGDTIYAGCSNLSEIHVYTYPELHQIGTLHTHGPIQKLWRRGTRLLVAVRTDDYGYRFGLQLLDLATP